MTADRTTNDARWVRNKRETAELSDFSNQSISVSSGSIPLRQISNPLTSLPSPRHDQISSNSVRVFPSSVFDFARFARFVFFSNEAIGFSSECNL